MDRVVERPGALDVHKEQVTACVRVPGEDGRARRQEVREFKTTVRGLLAMADWLRAHGVTVVAMEATGVYWRPVWHVLEGDFDLMLVNAAHVKNVPGRKTDVGDSQWLCQLLEFGLLQASFVPPQPVRELRELTRRRRRWSGSAPRRPTGCTRRWRTPGSSSTASPRTFSVSRAVRCSTRCWPANATPRSLPAWPRAG